jgi:hypothetical protein
VDADLAEPPEPAKPPPPSPPALDEGTRNVGRTPAPAVPDAIALPQPVDVLGPTSPSSANPRSAAWLIPAVAAAVVIAVIAVLFLTRSDGTRTTRTASSSSDATTPSSTAPCPKDDCTIPQGTREVMANERLNAQLPDSWSHWECSASRPDTLPPGADGAFSCVTESPTNAIATRVTRYVFRHYTDAANAVAAKASELNYAASTGACLVASAGPGYNPGPEDSLTYLCFADDRGHAQFWVIAEYAPDEVVLEIYERDDSDVGELADHWLDVS